MHPTDGLCILLPGIAANSLLATHTVLPDSANQQAHAMSESTYTWDQSRRQWQTGLSTKLLGITTSVKMHCAEPSRTVLAEVVIAGPTFIANCKPIRSYAMYLGVQCGSWHSDCLDNSRPAIATTGGSCRLRRVRLFLYSSLH